MVVRLVTEQKVLAGGKDGIIQTVQDMREAGGLAQLENEVAVGGWGGKPSVISMWRCPAVLGECIRGSTKCPL